MSEFVSTQFKSPLKATSGRGGHQPIENGEAGEADRGSLVIFLIWLLATLPMGLLAWGGTALFLDEQRDLPGLIFWMMVIIGMSWQMILSLIILRLEGVPSTWSAMKQRLWLTAPIWRPTGERLSWSFGLIPVFVLIALLGDEVVSHFFERTMIGQALFDVAPDYAKIESLMVPEAQGQWLLLGIALVSSVFNYALGEAFLFHGILLPRMERAWGSRAWIGNGLLFAAYHVHKFWVLPGLVVSCLVYALPSQAFRSNWFALIIHGIEGVFLIGIVTFLVVNGPPV